MALDQQALEAAFDVLWPLQEWGGEEAVCRAALSAAVTAYIAALGDGWRLVPVEPTEGMMNATPAVGAEAFKLIWPKICGDIYRAMLAAAPTPPGEKK